MLVTISRPPPTIDRPPSLNNYYGGSECYTAINCVVLFLNGVLRGQSLHSVLVYNFTNMHAMSYRSDFILCSCRVNIQEPGVCVTVILLSAVSRVRVRRFLIPTAMLDSKSLNTSLLEVMITFKNKCVCIHDLSDLTWQIIFDVGWASIIVGSKRPITWDNYWYAPFWRFYLHCHIQEASSPGIIRIVCHQFLRHLSEHGTSSMGKHLLANAQIAKLNELTESEVTELTS